MLIERIYRRSHKSLTNIRPWHPFVVHCRCPEMNRRRLQSKEMVRSLSRTTSRNEILIRASVDQSWRLPLSWEATEDCVNRGDTWRGSVCWSEYRSESTGKWAMWYGDACRCHNSLGRHNDVLHDKAIWSLKKKLVDKLSYVVETRPTEKNLPTDRFQFGNDGFLLSVLFELFDIDHIGFNQVFKRCLSSSLSQYHI